jgi:hypothetical protein
MLWRASEHEPLTERAWDPGCARESIAEIVADAEQAVSADGVWPQHPRDDPEEGEVWSSLYLGTAGMVWSLWLLGSRLDGARTIAAALQRYRTTPDFAQAPHPPSLWLGETGILIVADRVASSAADTERLRELIHLNRDHPAREVMWGSPGTMLAARACGLDAEWRNSAELLWARWEQDSGLWTQELYDRTSRYLGPAHGFAGTVHALRGSVPDTVLRERVSRALSPLALRNGSGLANWPPAPGDPPDTLRVQWCHGAPGIVATIGDLLPLELAISAGELTWQAGPLRKGSGLCHGTAGNGFALLRLHALTDDPMWLERARHFAMHAAAQVRAERDVVGHGRYTLFTGDVGVALYLRACLDADPAFPTMDVF